jgi:hypothetical protein
MFRFILIVLTILFFGIPFLYEQAFATETKVIEMNGKQWLVTIEPGEDPIFKSLEPKPAKVTKLPFVIHGNPEEKSIIPVVDVKKEPEWQKKTVKESKLVQVCNDPMGCEMTVEGDCPDCKTELVREETVEVVHTTDFSRFKDNIKNEQKLLAMVEGETLPEYLMPYQDLRDTGNPDWICWKVKKICGHGDPISIEDLFAGKMSASYCHTRNFWDFDYANPLQSCQYSTILNL